MQIKYCEDHQIYNVGNMDPKLVSDTLVKTKSVTTDEYIVKLFGVFQRKEYIFLPFNFRYIFNYAIVLWGLTIFFLTYD
jgi:hypothetical protein